MTSEYEPWVTCPLKQEIRERLWQSYIANLTGGKPLNRYLTLYSPPIMDVKHLTNCGLIRFDGEVYKGVIGVAFDTKAFAKSVGEGQGRLEGLFTGDINKKLSNRSDPDHKLLTDWFPFDAVNLDYTGSIFCKGNENPISLHLKALESLFQLQAKHDCQQYCLFLTTRSEPGAFQDDFLAELRDRIDANILQDGNFGRCLSDNYGVGQGVKLQNNSYPNFATLGIMKLVANILADFDYEAARCDAVWLVRDKNTPVREDLLHAAFLIRQVDPEPAKRLSQYGRRHVHMQDSVKHVVEYVYRVSKAGVPILKESVDRADLQKKHGATIHKLATQTYELKIPRRKA
jgi:hypothetical protein